MLVFLVSRHACALTAPCARIKSKGKGASGVMMIPGGIIQKAYLPRKLLYRLHRYPYMLQLSNVCSAKPLINVASFARTISIASEYSLKSRKRERLDPAVQSNSRLVGRWRTRIVAVILNINSLKLSVQSIRLHYDLGQFVRVFNIWRMPTVQLLHTDRYFGSGGIFKTEVLKIGRQPSILCCRIYVVGISLQAS